jgi:branched-chain amino acid transport system ATP-binding protein
MTALLSLIEMTKMFGGLAAVSALSMQVSRRSIHSVIGPNGAGKTTAFNCIAQFIKPTSGAILFDGQRIEGLRPDAIARLGIARTYQNIRLFPSLSVEDNVVVGLHIHLHAPWWAAVMKLPSVAQEEQAARASARTLLDYVGLRCDPAAGAATLSYGQQRRLEIARALAMEPTLLMLDEPTAGMNPAEIDDMLELIRRLRDERGLTILLIEHRVAMVMAVSDQVTVLDHGVCIADGTPHEIQRDPAVIAAYLGRKRDEGGGMSRAIA